MRVWHANCYMHAACQTGAASLATYVHIKQPTYQTLAMKLLIAITMPGFGT